VFAEKENTAGAGRPPVSETDGGSSLLLFFVVGVPATNRMDLVSTDHEINRLAVVLLLIHSFLCSNLLLGHGAHKCTVPYDMLRVFRRNVAPWFAPNAGN
jgi:hypothetical protein